MGVFQFIFVLPNMFRSFFSLVINRLANVDDFIQNGFGDIQKFAIEKLYKPFHDMLIIPSSACSWNLKTFVKKEKY